MQKELFIIRHAKAEQGEYDQKDFDRGLKPRGERDIRRIGEMLLKENHQPDLMLVSPALRTKLTAEILAGILDYPGDSIIFERNIYEASTRDLLQSIEKVEADVQKVFLIGHNPACSELVDYLIGRNETVLPTSGTAYLGFDFADWAHISSDTGILHWVRTPKSI